jgi:uncharacterized protein involved in exopolysaccharide biosynthesis
MMPQQKPDKRQEYTNPDLLQKALHQLLEQISKRDQKITERDTLLLYTQAQLKEKEAQLHEITNSGLWKLVVFIRRTRVFLVSPRSRRVSMLRRGWEVILSPFKRIGRN